MERSGAMFCRFGRGRGRSEMIGVHPRSSSFGRRLKVLASSNSKPGRIGARLLSSSIRGPLEDSRCHFTFSFHQVVSSSVVVRKARAQGLFFSAAAESPICIFIICSRVHAVKVEDLCLIFVIFEVLLVKCTAPLLI
jgi:hypothetical protein